VRHLPNPARFLKSHLAEVESSIEMRQNELFKARAVLHIQHVRTSSLVQSHSLEGTTSGGIFIPEYPLDVDESSRGLVSTKRRE